MRKLVSAIPALVVLFVALMALIVTPRIVERVTHAEQSAKVALARTTLNDQDVLRQIDQATSAIAQIVEPSVVHIETAVAPGSEALATLSSGAGWVFDSDGHLVTNAHVVQSAKRVSVEFYDGRVVSGSVVGMDAYTDIAVIKVQDAVMAFPAQRATQPLPMLGDRIYAFGSPFGFKFSMSEGIVSGLGREAAGSNVIGGYTNYIQTDAAVNPGNSGGPIVNTDAQVIGMNVAIATARSIGQAPEDSGADSAGISFAIPLGTIEPIVNQIIEHGSVERGYLGIRFNGDQPVRVTATANSGNMLSGIVINQVEEDGPSANSGLEPGDVIVSIQGSPVINDESLSSLISSSRPGDTIRVTVVREGRLRDYEITLGKMKDEVLARRIMQPIMVQMGMLLEPSQDHRIVVQTIWPGLPGSKSGFKQGDTIERVNGKQYDDYYSFFVLLADEGILTGEPIKFLVRQPDGETRTLTMRLHW